MTDIHPRLLELYKNEVASLCLELEQELPSDDKLEEAMSDLAHRFCATISCALNEAGAFFCVAGPEDFPDSVWRAVQERFCSSDRGTDESGTDEMRLLLWRQFQAWAADPKFRVPGGVLTIDDDRYTVVIKTDVLAPGI